MIDQGGAAYFLLASITGMLGAGVIAGVVLGARSGSRWLRRPATRAIGIVLGIGIVISGYALAGAVRGMLAR